LAEAATYCAGLTLGGLSGWRLPSLSELQSLVDNTVLSGPKINQTVFPNTIGASYYWTSSLDPSWTSVGQAGSSAGAWVVSFATGSSYGHDVGDWLEVQCVD
jgi:hypothetical protein